MKNDQNTPKSFSMKKLRYFLFITFIFITSYSDATHFYQAIIDVQWLSEDSILLTEYTYTDCSSPQNKELSQKLIIESATIKGTNFVLQSKEPLRKIILDEVIYQYQNIAPTYNAEIEKIEQIEDFISIKILCPISVQLSELIEEGLENLPFLVDNFVATNVVKPTLEKMKEWMSEKNDGEENPILN